MQYALRTPEHLNDTTGLLAIGLSEKSPRELPAALSDELRAALSRVLEDESFKGKAGASVSMRTLGRAKADWVILVGTGNGSAKDMRLAAGSAGSFARDRGATALTFAPGRALSDADAEAIAEGLVAGNYRYDRFQADDARKKPLEKVDLIASGGHVLAALHAGQVLAEAQDLVRDLVNGPAAEVYPESLAAVASSLASRRVSVEVWDEEKVKAAGMVGITAVGQGSDRKPRFVHMTYTPDGEAKGEIALVGKGVTFDSGGLSIKPSDGMLTMRCDMAGAATVIGVMKAVDQLGLPVKVHAIFGAVENMLSGNSYKLGDVLRYNNGKTVEVLNTDAEGRLVLADCLIYASKLPVSHIVDLATLTGAAVVGLGEHYTAMYTSDDSFSSTLLKNADAAGDGFWRMPLEPLYKDLIKGDWGQIKNTGGRMGGSITAALFLQEFVDGPTWAHLDIAGPAFLSANERHLQKGATGHGVGALLYWLRGL